MKLNLNCCIVPCKVLINRQRCKCRKIVENKKYKPRYYNIVYYIISYEYNVQSIMQRKTITDIKTWFLLIE